jgi:large subunit ribosomal protein L10
MADKYGIKVKKIMIEEMKDSFISNRGFLISSQTNINVPGIDQLRAALRKSGSRYFVVKNRLARIALNEADLKEIGRIMEQEKTLGVGFITDDPVGIAKMMKKFADDNEGFEVFSGYLDGKILPEEKIKELADLPSREQLLAKVVGTMNAPVTNMVMLMSTILRSFLYAINGIKEKRQEDQSK